MEESIRELELPNGEITDITISGTDTIVKQDGKRYASVQIAVSDPSSTALIVAAREKLEQEFDTSEFRDTFDLSEDAIDFDLGQEGENLESFQSAIVAVIIAILIMYSLLVLQFNSFTQPLLILVAIPLAFPGLFPGLYLTNNPISFFVIVGIVGLIGIVVNNTILLMDFANSMRNQLGIAESISEAIKARFRPLFTTSMTTLVGILPLALSNPFWEPLSYSIIFGLLSSTTLVILAFPVFYVALEHVRQFIWKAFHHTEFL
jgi:multidrug efflux pump subunit AcrB